MQSLYSASVGHFLQLQRVKVVDNASAIHISNVVMDYTVAIDHALP